MTASARKYKDSKPKLFLIFLLLALFFWVLTKFSKEYTATVDARLAYENLPAQTVLTKNNLNNISFDVDANGFEFLYYKFKKPRIAIDVSTFHRPDTQAVIIPNGELIKTITSQLNKDLAVKNLSVTDVLVQLNEIVSRKIPVRPVTQVSYKEGFKPRDSIVAEPDSVTVSGPSEIIQSIEFISTQNLVMNGVDRDVSQEVKLDFSGDSNVKIDLDEVIVRVQVQEYTQKQLQLPVQLINVPSGITVKLIPEQITLTFDVAMSKFNIITANNFRLVCDYAARNQEENFMLPKLLQKPEDIQNAEMSHKKIDYLTFK